MHPADASTRSNIWQIYIPVHVALSEKSLTLDYRTVLQNAENILQYSLYIIPETMVWQR